MDEGSEVDTMAVSSSKLTDTGNGHRFVEAYHGVVRWLIDEQEWRIWQGTHWRPYKTDEIPIAMAKQVSAMIFTEAERAESEEEVKILKKWAKQSLNSERLGAMIRMVKSDHRIWGSYEEFDRDPYLLNFTNGTVDLRTGAIKGHDPADKISCLVPHDYNPYTPAPLWSKLVTRCTDCDRSGETAEYLLRMLGYMLVGNNIEQKLPLIIGEKRTGKSKIIEICARLLGPDYAAISQSKLVTKSQWSTHHDSETWSIRGKRYVAISETDAGMDLDEARVKNLTGASTMSMRALYKAKETQVPVTWTIIIGTNEAPNVERWDDAIGRRVVKIPSGPTIDPCEVDLDLENKIIREEAEGVLASLVRGCVSWYQARSATGGSGLIMPTAVAEATREFQDENDHVSAFLHACVDFGPSSSVPAADLNKAYVAYRGGKGKGTYGTRALYSRILSWCQENGVPVSKDGRNFYGLQLASRDQAHAAQYQQWASSLSAVRR